jgi:hypothetical protein
MTVREARIILAADIASNLFPDNSFVNKAINDDAFATASKVELPQAGSLPTAVVDRDTFPLPVNTRVDVVKEYVINEISTSVTRLAFKDMLAANYNMAGEVVSDHTSVLENKSSENVAFKWAGVGDNIIRTTGEARRAILGTSTDNRAKIVRNDVLNVKRKMDAQDIPQENRQALFSAEMLNDLLEDANLMGIWELGERLRALGELSKLLGFEVNMRSTLLRYNNQLAPVNMGANVPTIAATDHAASLFWHPRFVRKAFKGVKVFLHLDDPSYQGDLYSAVAFTGASSRYIDGRGVYSIVEGVIS